LFFGIVLPVIFWLAAVGLDMAIGFPPLPISRPVGLIMTGLTWSLGLFWILWAYSYLLFIEKGSSVEAIEDALEPGSHLVTGGPYAYVRNPAIFGLLIILLGVAFLADSISGFILVPIAALISAAFIRLVEEKELLARFGAAYEHYRKSVPMLVPHLRPYIPPEVG
jgi:protein-S-isoprenylcysteine O-methyltransferase Ste14